jgi:7,8-dihydropterin-6-yl-methyl-4-(beta-D-ribofuranosyl)aminobenzene 5'-phosphate synthase
VRLTILVDNISEKKGLKSEHGFSAFLEAGDCHILFDTGQSEAIIHNARALGIELAALRHIVLSHGHYDHTGGLRAVLAVAKNARIYAHQAALEGKYKKLFPGIYKHIGMDARLSDILAEEKRVVAVEKPATICDNVTISGHVERKFSDASTTSRFFRKAGRKYEKENVPDDMALFVRSEKGTSVIAGCSHSGVLNIIEWARTVMTVDRLYAYVGGMHLAGADEDELAAVAGRLEGVGCQLIAPGHCTGRRAQSFFLERFGGRCIIPEVGMEMRL